MQYIKQLIAALAFVVLSLQLCGQDTHYSTLSPLSINPANTGVMSKANRLSTTGRNQSFNPLGKQSYQTLFASFDHQFTFLENDFIGVGGNLLKDEAGSSTFSTSKVSLAASYWKQVNAGKQKRRDYLIVGASIAGTNQRMKTNLNWSEQFTPNGYDVTINSGEDFSQLSNIYIDAVIGIQYYAFDTDKWYFQAGGAWHHFNRPNVGLLHKDIVLPSKWVIHASGFLMPTNTDLFLGGSISYQQQASYKMLLPRFELGFDLDNEYFISLGMGSRIVNNIDQIGVDALITAFKVGKSDLVFSISYDCNVSSNPSKGAWEASITYQWGKENKRGVYCPRNF